MSKQSAGLLPYRLREGRLEVFLVHPGGPFWAKKDAGAWSIAKGEIGEGESARDAAVREFREETGFTLEGDLAPLEAVKQPGGKTVHAWAVRAEALDAAAIRSGTFSMEWPPRSGKQREFPEVDRAAWLDLEAARAKINAGQAPLLDRLARLVAPAAGPG